MEEAFRGVDKQIGSARMKEEFLIERFDGVGEGELGWDFLGKFVEVGLQSWMQMGMPIWGVCFGSRGR